MVGLEVSRTFKIIVDDLTGLGPENNVAVITDEKRLEIAKAFTSSVRATGATAVLAVMPVTPRHGSEPPEMVAATLKEADTGFVLTTHSFTHTDAHREALESGTRISVMRGITEDWFTDGPSIEDYEEVDELTMGVKDRLQGKSTVHVTAPAGTDIEFDISERPITALGFKVNDMSDIFDFPQGEVAVAPVEGSANGTIVIDHALDNVGLLEDPIELTFENGEVVKVSGGVEADTLKKVMDEAGENAGNLAEFAIGTLKGARLTANVKEAKKRVGTIHFAIGDNKTLHGSVYSDIHLDGVVLNPTVVLDDDDVILDNGNLKVE